MTVSSLQGGAGNLGYLRAPFAANIKAGQRVVVVTDTAQDPRVWQAVLGILTELGADATATVFEPRPADYFDPPASVAEAMLGADVNVLLASTGMLHAAANSAAMEAGIPAICMDGGMTLEMFQSGAVTEDLTQMARIKHNVAERVFGPEARKCRVTSRYGTDLTYSVEGRIFVPPLPPADFDPYAVRKLGRPGSILLFHLFPSGELNVPPVEGSANGKLVIDLTMHHFGRLETPIELTISDGRVTQISGGAEAHQLRRYLEEYGDENAYMCPAEASVGINRRALVRGNQREDKNIFGAMHFGLGTNVDVGGSVHSAIHMDGVVLEPTLLVDGEMRIRDGQFLVPVDDDVA
jgi:2,5-dihydroxypyridine 5,6-dioxygenase